MRHAGLERAHRPVGAQGDQQLLQHGRGILVGSGGDNGDGHSDDLYYDFVNAPRGLPFNGDPSKLTPMGLGLGFTRQ